MHNRIILLTATIMLLSGPVCFAQNGSGTVELGYGISQRSDLVTASVDVITGEELQSSAAINLRDALYGRLLGLQALKTGGFEGDADFGADFNIRGRKTSSEDKVLILVDGLERPIDRLSVEEVESVTVLKDAAALALYGYKGLGGAILVKTKRGAEGPARVNVNYGHKLTFGPMIPEFVDGPTYARALNEARSNDGLSPAYNNYELDAFDKGTFPYSYPDVRWQSEILRDFGHENQANISVKGGTNAVRYYTLLNYVSNSGLLSNTELNDGYSTQLKSSKGNVRLNLDVSLTKTTEMTLNLLGSFIETNRPHDSWANGLINSFYTIPSSAFPVLNEDGVWGGNTTYGAVNPVAAVQAKGYDKNHSRMLLADARITQRLDALVKGLSASVRMGYDNFSEITETRGRGYEYESVTINFDGTGGVAGTSTSIAGDKTSNLKFNHWLNNQWRRFNMDASLDYKRSFSEDNLGVTLLYTGENFTTTGRSKTVHRQNIYGYFHYDHDSRYAADLVLGATGSNRSYPNKWDFSPTLSLAWLLSNERMLRNSSVVDLLKLRASAGILHNDYIPRADLAFENYEAGSAGNYFFGSGYKEIWGFFLGYTPTPDFLHETSNKFNLGLDAKLLGAFSATAEFFYERRNNILMSADGIVSKVYGLPSAFVNKGIVDSRGFEIGLRYAKAFGNGWLVNLGGMVTYGDNKVVDWVESPTPYKYLSKIGTSLSNRFVLESEGLFNSESEIASGPVQELGLYGVGDIRYKDQNDDGIVNRNDVIARGNFDPLFNYSFDFNVEYRGFGFDALFQGVGGYDVYLSTTGMFRPMINNSNLSRAYFEKCWRPGADNSSAVFPRLTTQDNPNNFAESTLWIADGDFLKLRNCEVYYRIIGKGGRSFVKDAKISLKGENLLSFSKIKVIDPELNNSRYPILKSVLLGFSITF